MRTALPKFPNFPKFPNNKKDCHEPCGSRNDVVYNAQPPTHYPLPKFP